MVSYHYIDDLFTLLINNFLKTFYVSNTLVGTGEHKNAPFSRKALNIIEDENCIEEVSYV